MLGLMLLPGSWMVIAVAVGVTLAKILARVPANRIAFNAAKDAITVGMAAAVGCCVQPSDAVRSPGQVAARAGGGRCRHHRRGRGAGHPGARARDRRADPARVRQRRGGPDRRRRCADLHRALHRLPAGFDNRLALVTPVIAVGWHFYFANRMQQRTERYSWRGWPRPPTRSARPTRPSVHDAAVRGAADMFNCDEVEIEIRLPGVEPRLIRGDCGRGHLRRSADRTSTCRVTRFSGRTLDTQDGSAAGRTGELRLYFRKRVTFGEREHFTLRAYAATIGTALRKTAAVAEAARMTTAARPRVTPRHADRPGQPHVPGGVCRHLRPAGWAWRSST